MSQTYGHRAQKLVQNIRDTIHNVTKLSNVKIIAEDLAKLKAFVEKYKDINENSNITQDEFREIQFESGMLVYDMKLIED